eukprot:3497263-Prymnesium_polylepis.1
MIAHPYMARRQGDAHVIVRDAGVTTRRPTLTVTQSTERGNIEAIDSAYRSQCLCLHTLYTCGSVYTL